VNVPGYVDADVRAAAGKNSTSGSFRNEGAAFSQEHAPRDGRFGGGYTLVMDTTNFADKIDFVDLRGRSTWWST